MFFKSLLPNGVRIISETVPGVKSVTLGVWVGAGSRFEQETNQGISHFIEHLLFKGTEKRTARDIAESIDAVGGQLNAFTAKEYTCYYVKVLATQIDFAMELLSDMILASRFAPEDIVREREVVWEEYNMYEDTPDELIHDLHLADIWPANALGRNILGNNQSLGVLNREMVLEYYRHFYTPDNLVIAAAGNLDHDKLTELSARYFGRLTGQVKQPEIIPPVFKPGKSVKTKDIEQVHFCLGTRGVPQNSPAIYPYHILNSMLGGGISSRLFQSIREDRGLAYSIYSYQTNYSDAGLFTIYAGTRPANTNKVIELILTNIRKMKNNSITADELAKVKEQLKGNLLLGLEGSSSRMSRIAKLEMTLGKYLTLDEVVAKINQVTRADVEQALATIFEPDNICLTALGPVDETTIPANLNI